MVENALDQSEAITWILNLFLVVLSIFYMSDRIIGSTVPSVGSYLRHHALTKYVYIATYNFALTAFFVTIYCCLSIAV